MKENNLIHTNFSIKEQYQITKSKIMTAAKKANRKFEDIHLIAISKTKPLELVQQAVNAKVLEIGENKIQECQDKWPHLQGSHIRHFVGHLQRNKAKQFVRLGQIIHSIDKWDTAKALDQEIAKTIDLGQMPDFADNYFHIPKQKIGFFLQVNSTDEPSKFGVEPDQALSLAESLIELEHLVPLGLMTIGPTHGSVADNRHAFAKTRILCQKLADTVSPDYRYLSMGMSADYLEAILEGATHVRIGTAIFGERNYEPSNIIADI